MLSLTRTKQKITRTIRRLPLATAILLVLAAPIFIHYSLILGQVNQTLKENHDLNIESNTLLHEIQNHLKNERLRYGIVPMQ